MPAIDLVDLASRYWQSVALNAGASLGVFEAVAPAPLEASALADKLGSAPEHTRALADALCGLGVLAKQNDAYAIPDDLRPLLDPDSPDCLLPVLRFNADLFGLWTRLPDCIRNGAPALPGNPHLGADPQRMAAFVAAMHSRAGVMARGLLPHLNPPRGARVLDVGGGPGTFSMKLAQRDLDLRATVLDLPPIAEAARKLHAGRPAADRVTFIGGDYHTADLPGQQDIVLYCGAIHQEPQDAAAALLPRLVAALKPGGELWVIDLMLDEDRTTPAFSALFALNMMLMRPASHVHAKQGVAALLTKAGCEAVEIHDMPDTPYTQVRGRKPRRGEGDARRSCLRA